MYYFDNSKIEQYLSIHRVGNKYEEEQLQISKKKIVYRL
jgi:hypothetical protein